MMDAGMSGHDRRTPVGAADTGGRLNARLRENGVPATGADGDAIGVEGEQSDVFWLAIPSRLGRLK